MYRRQPSAGFGKPTAALQAPEAADAGAQQVHRAGDLRRLCSDLAGARLGRGDHPRGGARNRHRGRHAVRLLSRQGSAAVGLCAPLHRGAAARLDDRRHRRRRPAWRERACRLVRITCDTTAARPAALRPRHADARAPHGRAQAPPARVRRAGRPLAAGAGVLHRSAAATRRRPRCMRCWLAAWGARRYRLLVQPGDDAAWLAEMEALVLARLAPVATAETDPGPSAPRPP